MITCNLSKPEATFDQVRKQYKDIPPTDVALLSMALVESGRMAVAIHDGLEYAWNGKYDTGLSESLAREVAQVQEAVAGEKKKTAKGVEEESVGLTVHLKPSVPAGELILGNRNDLKVLFADMLNEGVEFLFSATDIGWHWNLERVNWTTFTGGELGRRIHFHAEFMAPHTTGELGVSGKKKVVKSKA